MGKIYLKSFLISSLFTLSQAAQPLSAQTMNNNYSSDEKVTDNKLVIYQMMPRLFGNKKITNKYYGSKEENGVGKFNDINDKALKELKKLGISHVWYTGVIEHATMSDYSAIGIDMDDPDVVKGRAGSPYAIKDYYDVDPDLAVDPTKRMKEFMDLIMRTHNQGLKVIIDFVPNHVARTYKSDSKPLNVDDLGARDDNTQAFSPSNNFYYLPGKQFKVPEGYNPGGNGFHHNMKDGKFDENPAKVTGNNVFSASPSKDDWFETIKLNYGVDIQHSNQKHFEQIPNTWKQMKDILVFWTERGVDGFRCDMCEMVPVEFWEYAIAEARKVNANVKFIGEAYNPKSYNKYIERAKFDYLYDKVGLYDGLKKLTVGQGNTDAITNCWKQESKGISSNMLRFMENHDEQRIPCFAGDPFYAIPAMTVSATLSSGPVMIYFGQEVGEPGSGVEGFGGDDGRTTIFDFWGVPEHQKWMNEGKFDGEWLSDDQKRLRSFYSQLLNVSGKEKAIRQGAFYELQDVNRDGKSSNYNNFINYSFLRYTPQERVLVVVTFDKEHDMEARVKIPQEAWNMMGLDPNQTYSFTDMLGSGFKTTKYGADMLENAGVEKGLRINMPTMGAMILKIEKAR